MSRNAANRSGAQATSTPPPPANIDAARAPDFFRDTLPPDSPPDGPRIDIQPGELLINRERRERIATAVLAGHLATASMGVADPHVIADEVRKALRYADALIAELDR